MPEDVLGIVASTAYFCFECLRDTSAPRSETVTCICEASDQHRSIVWTDERTDQHCIVRGIKKIPSYFFYNVGTCNNTHHVFRHFGTFGAIRLCSKYSEAIMNQPQNINMYAKKPFV